MPYWQVIDYQLNYNQKAINIVSKTNNKRALLVHQFLRGIS